MEAPFLAKEERDHPNDDAAAKRSSLGEGLGPPSPSRVEVRWAPMSRGLLWRPETAEASSCRSGSLSLSGCLRRYSRGPCAKTWGRKFSPTMAPCRPRSSCDAGRCAYGSCALAGRPVQRRESIFRNNSAPTLTIPDLRSKGNVYPNRPFNSKMLGCVNQR